MPTIIYMYLLLEIARVGKLKLWISIPCENQANSSIWTLHEYQQFLFFQIMINYFSFGNVPSVQTDRIIFFCALHWPVP